MFILNYRKQEDEPGAAGGAAAPEWMQSLPEEYRDNQMLSQYKDMGSAMKGFMDTKQALSQGVRLPSSEAGETEIADFRRKMIEKNLGLIAMPEADDNEGYTQLMNKLGRPEEAAGYELPEVEGINLPEDRVNFLRSTAHEAGVTNKQFKHFMAKVLESDAAGMQASEQERMTGISDLKGQWGGAYDAKMVRAGEFLKNSEAPDSLLEALTSGQLGKETLSWLDALATRTGAKGVTPLQDSSGSDVLTPDECRSRADEIMNKLSEMKDKNQVNNPEYLRLVQKRADYIKLAHAS